MSVIIRFHSSPGSYGRISDTYSKCLHIILNSSEVTARHSTIILLRKSTRAMVWMTKTFYFKCLHEKVNAFRNDSLEG